MLYYISCELLIIYLNDGKNNNDSNKNNIVKYISIIIYIYYIVYHIICYTSMYMILADISLVTYRYVHTVSLICDDSKSHIVIRI